jgi:hypothetical protein
MLDPGHDPKGNMTAGFGAALARLWQRVWISFCSIGPSEIKASKTAYI